MATWTLVTSYGDDDNFGKGHLETIDAISPCGGELCVLGRDEDEVAFLKRFDAQGNVTGNVPDLGEVLGTPYFRLNRLSFGKGKVGYLSGYDTLVDGGDLQRVGYVFRLTLP